MPLLEPRQKFGRKVERMITQYLEDLDPNYVVYTNSTELGPIDLVVVNLESGKSVYVDCKGTKSKGVRRHVPPKITNRHKWKHLDRGFLGIFDYEYELHRVHSSTQTTDLSVSTYVYW